LFLRFTAQLQRVQVQTVLYAFRLGARAQGAAASCQFAESRLSSEEREFWRKPSLQQVDVAYKETNDDDTARQAAAAWLLLTDGLGT
jgi:uncharacterized membrane protein